MDLLKEMHSDCRKALQRETYWEHQSGLQGEKNLDCLKDFQKGCYWESYWVDQKALH